MKVPIKINCAKLTITFFSRIFFCSFWFLCGRENNGKTVTVHIIPYLAMEHHTVFQPQMKHHRAKPTVHKIQFNRTHYQRPTFQIQENERHIHLRE